MTFFVMTALFDTRASRKPSPNQVATCIGCWMNGMHGFLRCPLPRSTYMCPAGSMCRVSFVHPEVRL